MKKTVHCLIPFFHPRTHLSLAVLLLVALLAGCRTSRESAQPVQFPKDALSLSELDAAKAKQSQLFEQWTQSERSTNQPGGDPVPPYNNLNGKPALIWDQLRQIKVEHLSFTNTPLPEVIQKLSEISAQQKKRIHFTLVKNEPTPPGVPSATNLPRVNLTVQDASLQQVLIKILHSVDSPLHFSISDRGVLFLVKPAADFVVTKTFQFPWNPEIERFLTLLGKTKPILPRKIKTKSPLTEKGYAFEGILRYLWQHGVYFSDFSAEDKMAEGTSRRSVYFNHSNKLLLVRAPLPELAVVEQALHFLAHQKGLTPSTLLVELETAILTLNAAEAMQLQVGEGGLANRSAPLTDFRVSPHSKQFNPVVLSEAGLAKFQRKLGGRWDRVVQQQPHVVTVNRSVAGVQQVELKNIASLTNGVVLTTTGFSMDILPSVANGTANIQLIIATDRTEFLGFNRQEPFFRLEQLALKTDLKNREVLVFGSWLREEKDAGDLNKAKLILYFVKPNLVGGGAG